MTKATPRRARKAKARRVKLPNEERTRTARGFRLIEFTDCYGEKCSVQKSSLAEEDCIWLGGDGSAKRLVYGEGWKAIDLGPGIQVHSRMHLTRENVAALLPILKRFAETGELP